MELEELMKKITEFEESLKPVDGEYMDPSDEIGMRDMLREEFLKHYSEELFPNCLKYPIATKLMEITYENCGLDWELEVLNYELTPEAAKYYDMHHHLGIYILKKHYEHMTLNELEFQRIAGDKYLTQSFGCGCEQYAFKELIEEKRNEMTLRGEPLNSLYDLRKQAKEEDSKELWKLWSERMDYVRDNGCWSKKEGSIAVEPSK